MTLKAEKRARREAEKKGGKKRSGDVLIPFCATIQKFGKQPSPAWGRNSDGRLMIRCICGVPMGLDHEVADSGEVSPSLWHNAPPECDWHVMGTLVGWPDGQVSV